MTASGAQGNAALVTRTVADLHNGSYRVSLGELSNTEAYKLDVKVAGTSTTKSPPLLLPVTFDAPDAPHCTATGLLLHQQKIFVKEN